MLSRPIQSRFVRIICVVLLFAGCGGGGGTGGTPVNWPRFNLPVMNPNHQVVVSTVSDNLGTVTSAQITSGGFGTFTLDAQGQLLVDAFPTQTLGQQHSSYIYADYFGVLRNTFGSALGFIDVWSGGYAAGTQYVEFGTWELIQVTPFQYGVYHGGNNTLTPPSMMPSGTATYVGKVLGEVFNVDSRTTHQLTGAVSASVNFATGNLQISLTGLQARNNADSTITAFNDVQMILNVSSNGFTGTTLNVSNGSGAAALLPTAIGQADGNFYGPSAQEISGVWHLQDGHGNLAIAGFGAR